MNIPWIAAFCETPGEEERLNVLALALKEEFGHVIKSGEPIAWQKAAAGVIKYARDHGVFIGSTMTKLAAQMDNLGEEDD